MLATVTRFRKVGIRLLFDAKVVRTTRTPLLFVGLEIHADGERDQEIARTWLAVFE